MKRIKIIRTTLLTTAIFNTIVALLVAFPTTPIAKLLQLPEPGSVFYTSVLALLVGLFGAAYAWMARQEQIDRPLLTLATVGKLGVFVISLYCWLTGVITFLVFTVAIADLIFASIFAWWLLTESRSTASVYPV